MENTTESHTGANADPHLPKPNGAVAYVQATLFVAVYIALGYLLKPDANVYLLMGIPLTIAFQLGVRKQPLHRLWVRDSGALSFNKPAIAVALALMVLPATEIVLMLVHKKWNPVVCTYLLVTCIGASGAGFAFSKFSKKTFKQLLMCLLVTGSIGGVLSVLGPLAVSMSKGTALHFAVPVAARSLFIYIPVSFIMEEVIFRGMLDTHIHTPGTGKNFWSAWFVSVLWGVWHLPVVPPSGHPVLISCIPLIIVHSLVGVPLSIFWRKSGNLGVTAFSHAFIDAVRNAMM
jgi:membrane protease YdiL (CAAX protease family)